METWRAFRLSPKWPKLVLSYAAQQRSHSPFQFEGRGEVGARSLSRKAFESSSLAKGK